MAICRNYDSDHDGLMTAQDFLRLFRDRYHTGTNYRVHSVTVITRVVPIVLADDGYLDDVLLVTVAHHQVFGGMLKARTKHSSTASKKLW